MPRQAAASRAFAANGSTRQLLQPPGDLNELEKAEFVDVVLGSPASHFQPLQAAGRDPRGRDRLSIFLLYRVWSQSGRNLEPC